MKTGITGATGHLGRMIVEKLKEKIAADDIVALVRSPQKAADLGIEARRFDYTNPNSLVDKLKDIDKLLFISGTDLGKRIEQHANVINAAQKAGLKEIVYTSILRADTSTLALAEEHLETEKKIIASGIPYTILRNGWYTENYTGSLNDVITHGVLLGCSGEGKISSATRADFAEAAAVVLASKGHTGKIYELAGDEAFTMSDYATEISKQTGKNIPYKNLTPEEFAATLNSAGIPEGIAQFLAGIQVSTEKGDLYDDTHQLSKLIGRATTPLSEVIAKALNK